MAGAPEFVEIDGLRVRITRTGTRSDAPPVLILHGWGASIDAVGSILSGLGPRLDVLAVDLPGHGETDLPPAPWTTEDYARFVLALLDQQGIERASVIAHSFGGRLALQLSHLAPERLARIIITGGAGLRAKRPASYYGKVAIAKLGRFVGAVGGPPGRRLQARMRARVASADWLAVPELLRETLRNVLAEDLRPLLPGVRSEVLLLWGTHDADTPLWMGRVMEQEIPGAALVELDGGHYAYAEQAAQFNTIALTFLEGARA